MILPALTIALGLTAGFLLIRHIPPCPPAEARSQESVSIIIPARNEEKTCRDFFSRSPNRRPAPRRCLSWMMALPTEPRLAAGLGARVFTSAAKARRMDRQGLGMSSGRAICRRGSSTVP